MWERDAGAVNHHSRRHTPEAGSVPEILARFPLAGGWAANWRFGFKAFLVLSVPPGAWRQDLRKKDHGYGAIQLSRAAGEEIKREIAHEERSRGPWAAVKMLLTEVRTLMHVLKPWREVG